MNKKVLSFIAALTICAGFSACSKDDSSSDSIDEASSVIDSSITDSSSDIDSSVIDSSDTDSSVPDSSEPDSNPDESSDIGISVTYMTVPQLTEAFLDSLESGDIDASYSYCGDEFRADLTSEDFTSIIFEEDISYQEYTTADGNTITVGTVIFTIDGKIKSDYAFISVIESSDTNVILDISLKTFPTEKLVDMGVPAEDIIPPKPDDVLGSKNAEAIAVMCGDIIADAQAFGQSIPDGVYKKNDGSDLCDSINANLKFQGIEAYDYEVTISGGVATEVSIFDESGEKTEYFSA